jgi:hypothetical protein
MTISINGGPSATLTRSSPWFVDLAAATQAELARALTSALNPLDSDNNSGVTLSSTVTMVDSQAQCFKDVLNFEEFDGLIISSPILGVVSSIKATGGTAGAALGLTNEASPVASANLLTLPVSSNRVFPITGSTTLNMIVKTSWTAGDVIALKFGSPINVAHNTGSSTSANNRIYLKDKTSWFAQAGDILYLTNNTDADGGNNYWYEVGRTVGTNARFQWAWILAHFMPNNVSSENQHQHISFEVADRKGDMQTRLGIIYGSNKTLVTVTSADFAVNGGRILVDPTSGIVGTSDITPQNKVRRWRLRTNSTTGNLDLQVYDDTGATSTTLLSLHRASSSVVMANGAFQMKSNSSNTTAASTLTLASSAGNTFPISGTTTINYITTTNWQSGAEVSLTFTSTPTLTNNAGTVPADTAALLLRGGVDWPVDAGANIKLRYNGTNWTEISRTSFVGQSSAIAPIVPPTATSVVLATELNGDERASTQTDTAWAIPVDLTGASQFRLVGRVGGAAGDANTFIRAYSDNPTSGADLSTATLLGATGSEIALGSISTNIAGPWENIASAARTTRLLKIGIRNTASTLQSPSFKRLVIEYR